MKDFRIHLTFRLRGQPVSTSCELKSEHYEDIDELIIAAAESISMMVLEEGGDDD